MIIALKIPAILAVPVGLAWGVAILSLDRWLVTSIPAVGGRRFGLALPRVLLALLLGVVISTPLVLQIFKPEIDARLVEMQRQRGDAFVLAQQTGGIGRRITALEKSAADLQKVIISGGDVALDPASDPRLKELTEARKKAKGEQDKYYAEWQCQLYGGENCLKKGPGPLAQQAKANHDKALARVRGIDKDIDARRTELAATAEAGKSARLAQAQEDLGHVQRELETLYTQRNELRKKFGEENPGSDGLLLRLEALNEVAKENVSLNAARILLFLFFLLIECLPVMVKLMQRPGGYETILTAKVRQETAAALEEIRMAARPRGRTPSAATRTRRIVDAEPQTAPHATAPPAEGTPPGQENPGSWEDRTLRGLRDNRTARLAAAKRDHTLSGDDW